MPDFIKFIEPLTRSVIVWLHFIFHPFQSASTLFDEMNDEISWEPLLEIWIPTTFVGYLISLQLYGLFGIAWNDVVFYSAFLFVQIAQPFVTAYLLNVFLRFDKLRSNFRQTLAICTITYAYTPVMTLALLAYTIPKVSQFKEIKHANASVLAAINQFLSIISNVKNTDPISIQLIPYVAGFISILAFTACVEATAQLYKNPRWRTYRAGGLTLTFSIFPALLIFWPIIVFATYNQMP